MTRVSCPPSTRGPVGSCPTRTPTTPRSSSAQLYRWVPEEDLRAHGVPELTAPRSRSGTSRAPHTPGTPLVRAFVPTSRPSTAGARPTPSSQVVSDDMPFLVDSVRHGAAAARMRRAAARPPGHRRRVRSCTSRSTAATRAGSSTTSAARSREVLGRRAQRRSRTGRRCCERTRALRDGARRGRRHGPGRGRRRGARAARLARRRALHLPRLPRVHAHARGRGVALIAVEGTGLGILRRHGQQRSGAFARLPPRIRAIAHLPRTLTLTKANARSTVHRPVPMDYIGVKRFDDAGPRDRRAPPARPAHRRARTRRDVHRRPDRAAQGAAGARARRAAARRPRREGADGDPRHVPARRAVPDRRRRRSSTTRSGSSGWASASACGCSCARDGYERFVSCLVYLPRERFNTANRLRIGEILRDARRRRGHRTGSCG